ncbi:MAG: hypothetical protein AB1791_00610 [Chloroflexota bacterium]
MTTNVDVMGRPVAAVKDKRRLMSDLTFDWVLLALFGWFVTGIFLDGWAHNHLIETLETFFTPWHGVLYSGFTVVALFVVTNLVYNHRRGYEWSQALPAGHNVTGLGVLIFALGGVGDMLWHTIFGIEANVDAAFSPSHLGLVVGGALIFSGPWRAGWLRRNEESIRGWRGWLPILFSITFAFSILSFISQYAHPLVRIEATRIPPTDASQIIGAVSIMLQTALLMGAVLLAVRRWRLPFGSLTLIFTVNALAMSFMQYQFKLILPVFLAGLVGDVLNGQLKPAVERPAAFRLFAFLVPIIYYLFYFVTLMITDGIWWTVHMWTGATVVAGFISLGLSLLLTPPAVPK